MFALIFTAGVGFFVFAAQEQKAQAQANDIALALAIDKAHEALTIAPGTDVTGGNTYLDFCVTNNGGVITGVVDAFITVVATGTFVSSPPYLDTTQVAIRSTPSCAGFSGDTTAHPLTGYSTSPSTYYLNTGASAIFDTNVLESSVPPTCPSSNPCAIQVLTARGNVFLCPTDVECLASIVSGPTSGTLVTTSLSNYVVTPGICPQTCVTDTATIIGATNGGSVRFYYSGSSTCPASSTSGTSTGATGTTLVDTSQSWTANQWFGYTVKITSGAAAGESGVIVSNTKNTLYISSTWAILPSSNSYTIAATSVGSAIPVTTEGDYTSSPGQPFPNAGTYYWYATYTPSSGSPTTSPCEPLTVTTGIACNPTTQICLASSSSGLGFLSVDFNGFHAFNTTSSCTISPSNPCQLVDYLPGGVPGGTIFSVANAPFGYTLSQASSANIIFSINITNTDPAGRSIVLDTYSLFFYFGLTLSPSSGFSQEAWIIGNVTNAGLATGTNLGSPSHGVLIPPPTCVGSICTANPVTLYFTLQGGAGICAKSIKCPTTYAGTFYLHGIIGYGCTNLVLNGCTTDPYNSKLPTWMPIGQNEPTFVTLWR